MNQKGTGQLLLIAVVIIAVVIGGLYLKFSKTQKSSNLSQFQSYSTPTPTPTPTPHPEAKSLEIPKNHSRISWKTRAVTDKEPVYLHFNGKEFGSEVPLTGKIIEGVIVDNPETNTLVEDYYRSNLEKQGWVRKILQIPGYQLGILAGRSFPFCQYRDSYVYMGHKNDTVQLVMITSGIDPDPGCSEMAPAPSVFEGNRNIKYSIFISDPLPVEVIRQKEFEIS